MKPAFVYPQTGDQKKILCVRVDGASDEGPSHQEIQYWKCLENLQMERLSTLVIAHSSGLSYLKSQTHSNLFIPMTLVGSCTEPVQVNEKILKQNLERAIEIYIKRVD